MNSPIVAGLISAIPLAIILVIYVLVRGKALVSFFRDQDQSLAAISPGVLFWFILAGFVLAAVLFGMLAGVVYGWLGTPRYQYLVVGGIILFSVLAIFSRQPLTGDKIIWNLAVGLVLGIMVPFLSQ